MDTSLPELLPKLYGLGYVIEVDAEQVCARWQGECPPPQAIVFPLLVEAQRRQADILAAFTRLVVSADDAEASARTRAQRPSRTRTDRQSTKVRGRRAPDCATV